MSGRQGASLVAVYTCFLAWYLLSVYPRGMAKGERQTIWTVAASYGGVVALALGILCGATTLGAFIAKPDGWQTVVVILIVIGAGLGAVAWRAEVWRRAKTVRCGAKDVGSPLYCGKKVPVWFVSEKANGSRRCGVCMSGGQLRYPEESETKAEYEAYVRATGDEHNALVDEYERLAAELGAHPDASNERGPGV